MRLVAGALLILALGAVPFWACNFGYVEDSEEEEE